MDDVARLPTDDRAALFGETGAGRDVANTIIEKDFWVCWSLKRLFGLPKGTTATLVFKGGTSLSKAFNAIRRFSEDIDLSFDRSELGYTGERDPDKEGISKKQAARLIDDLVSDVEQHIAERLLPALRAAIVEQLGEPTESEWSLEIDAGDAQTVNFHYPTALPTAEYEGMAYITPRVKFELGARGDPWPTEEKVIRPYAADDYQDFFTDPDTSVTVLSARRTFWEKATALHAEAHRPAGSPTPLYFSRHFYDLAMLLETDDGQGARPARRPDRHSVVAGLGLVGRRRREASRRGVEPQPRRSAPSDDARPCPAADGRSPPSQPAPWRLRAHP